jgi:hypothetical protein
MQRLAALSFSTLIALVGCGPSAVQNEEIPGPGPDGDDDPSPPPELPDAGNCGEQQEEIELVEVVAPPDMLIVLDRSASMTITVDTAGNPTRWDVMVDALTDLTNSQQGNINFGLMVFPTDSVCGVADGALVDPAPNNASAIQGQLASTSADGGATPGALALQQANSAYASLPVNPDGRYVLFATDGAPNCAGNPESDTVSAVTALKNAGIDTFVLGFGDSLGTAHDTLNSAALEGGQAKGSDPYYYQADNPTELANVLDQIAGGVVVPSCSYELAELPPEPDNVTVLADGQPVPRATGGGDGWDYQPDESTITFTGSYCTGIQDGTISQVEFIFGCQGPQID